MQQEPIEAESATRNDRPLTSGSLPLVLNQINQACEALCPAVDHGSFNRPSDSLWRAQEAPILANR